ncbi:hypothetical protein KP77_24890 [Jeotgalibacillus alimentarius]|uniref:Uncharacterized protein n=1 Tax=Jeotgalibacillus alimentarius TaxID=135826 RepID=A0A0C2VR48_9BACL|nr:hypothetical protein [Jeotgalibacillus alimentarius]KIL46921.1 hypothetical protein KP77_24890 [Jeotgalibacillus alimentarius]
MNVNVDANKVIEVLVKKISYLELEIAKYEVAMQEASKQNQNSKD